MKLLKILLLSLLLTKTAFGQLQTRIDTTCIKTEQLRKLVIDARKSKLQAEQIENLQRRRLKDSIIIRNDSVIIDNKTREIEQKQAQIKKERASKSIWQIISGILGAFVLTLVF